MNTSGAVPCDVLCWRATSAGDARVRRWARRIDRAAWRRGLLLPWAVAEGLARRIVAGLYLAAARVRMLWRERLARCGSVAVALRSWSQALRGASR